MEYVDFCLRKNWQTSQFRRRNFEKFEL